MVVRLPSTGLRARLRDVQRDGVAHPAEDFLTPRILSWVRRRSSLTTDSARGEAKEKSGMLIESMKLFYIVQLIILSG